MNKVKIMQVVYVLKSGAGVEQLVLDFANHFNSDSYETCVVGFKSGSLLQELKSKCIQVFSLDKRTGFDLSFIVRFNSLIRELQPHIIHSHTLSPNFWSIILGKHFRETKNISTVHTIIRKRAIYKPFYDYVNLYSDRIVAVSENVKDNYSDCFKVDKKKLEVIYSGIARPGRSLHHAELQLLRKKLKLNPMLKTAISVGRPEQPKGHKYLIHAAHLLVKRGLRINFLVVGDGSLKNDLIELTRKLGLFELFNFTGYRSDVSDLIQIADFAVMSSIREGFSIALLEFMAMGMPLVITDVGGNREAVKDRVSAIIVPPADPQALAKGIEQVLSDVKFATRLGSEARRAYEQKFTKENMMQRYEELYREVLKNATSFGLL